MAVDELVRFAVTATVHIQNDKSEMRMKIKMKMKI